MCFLKQKAAGSWEVTNAAELLVHAIQLDVGWHALPLFLQDNSEVLAQHIRGFSWDGEPQWRCALQTCMCTHMSLLCLSYLIVIIIMNIPMNNTVYNDMAQENKTATLCPSSQAPSRAVQKKCWYSVCVCVSNRICYTNGIYYAWDNLESK